MKSISRLISSLAFIAILFANLSCGSSYRATAPSTSYQGLGDQGSNPGNQVPAYTPQVVSPSTSSPQGTLIGVSTSQPSLGQEIAQDCIKVVATDVTKGACGIDATVQCPSDHPYVMSGGGYYGSNLALQNDYPVFNSSGQPTGWKVSWLDTEACSINAYADGTTRPGSKPCFANPKPGRGELCGGVIALCCQ